MTQDAAIRALIQKWRDKAASNGAIYAQGIEECADELEAVLASTTKVFNGMTLYETRSPDGDGLGTTGPNTALDSANGELPIAQGAAKSSGATTAAKAERNSPKAGAGSEPAASLSSPSGVAPQESETAAHGKRTWSCAAWAIGPLPLPSACPVHGKGGPNGPCQSVDYRAGQNRDSTRDETGRASITCGNGRASQNQSAHDGEVFSGSSSPRKDVPEMSGVGIPPMTFDAPEPSGVAPTPTQVGIMPNDLDAIMDDYDTGYEKRYKHIPSLVDEIRELRAALSSSRSATPTDCIHSGFTDGCLHCALRDREALEEVVVLLRTIHGDTRNRYDLRAAASLRPEPSTEPPSHSLLCPRHPSHSPLDSLWGDGRCNCGVEPLGIEAPPTAKGAWPRYDKDRDNPLPPKEPK